jgi:two-component system KDP operon response regulator KdpE
MSASAKSQVQAVKACSPTPLIGLLPSEDVQAVIEALDARVDDCIAKPFGLDALAAQIRKVLRRDMWCRGEAPYFSSPTLQIDSIRCQVYRSGRPLRLSRRQFRLFQLLLDADGRVLTHHALLRAIWAGGADGATIGALRQAIAELRRKIEPNPRRPRHSKPEPNRLPLRPNA